MGGFLGHIFGKVHKNVFLNTISQEFVSLPGYDNTDTDKSRADVIYTLLRSAKKDDVIIGYSHSATTILFF